MLYSSSISHLYRYLDTASQGQELTLLSTLTSSYSYHGTSTYLVKIEQQSNERLEQDQRSWIETEEYKYPQLKLVTVRRVRPTEDRELGCSGVETKPEDHIKKSFFADNWYVNAYDPGVGEYALWSTLHQNEVTICRDFQSLPCEYCTHHPQAKS